MEAKQTDNKEIKDFVSIEERILSQNVGKRILLCRMHKNGKEKTGNEDLL